MLSARQRVLLELLVINRLKKRRLRRLNRRRFYVRPEHLNRPASGAFTTIVQDLRDVGHARHHQYVRMSPEKFDELYDLLKPDLLKKPTHLMPIPPKQRLMMAMRFLASGDSVAGISIHYKVGEKTVRDIIYGVCASIRLRLGPLVLKKLTEEDWKEIATGFEQKWNFPMCAGAVDGKHVHIKKPPGTGTLYYNYKGSFSVVLMAIADADMRFRVVYVGAPGRGNDSGIFSATAFGQQLSNGTLNLPPGLHRLGNSEIRVPYVFVGDEAFALQPNLMHAFPASQLGDTGERAIFNYRLSRARRIVESAFGLLVTRWRVLAGTMGCSPDHAAQITYACTCLHNWLLSEKDAVYSATVDEPPPPMQPLQTMTAASKQRAARKVREDFMDYFNGIGALSYQEDRAARGRC